MVDRPLVGASQGVDDTAVDFASAERRSRDYCVDS